MVALQHAAIFQRVKENYTHNKFTIQIQVLGLLSHSVLCGLYAHTAYKYSIVNSAAFRFSIGMVWVLPPLVKNFQKFNKWWLLSFLLYYAGESAIMMVASFLHSLEANRSLAIAAISTAVQTAIAGLVYLRRS